MQAKIKTSIIYLAVVLGLSAVLGILSRISADFSEWYAMNLYPLVVGSVGRVFGVLPFSFAEIFDIMIGVGVVAFIVCFIVRMVKNKSEKKQIFVQMWLVFLCIAATFLLIFLLNCGINYNRRTFLHRSGVNAEQVDFKRTQLDECMVFLTLLDELYQSNALNEIQTDENGSFRLSADLKREVPAAMRNLGSQNSKLNVYYPPPKPVSIFSGLVSDMFILGFFWPYTMEANYNSIAPDSQMAVTQMHELAHISGFMREEEANYIAFLAGKESENADLIYSSYLEVLIDFDVSFNWDIYSRLPERYQDLLVDCFDFVSQDREDKEEAMDYLRDSIAEERLYIGCHSLLPRQIMNDWRNQYDFWNSRIETEEYVYDQYGDVVEVVVVEKPVAKAVKEASSSVNDTYLKMQGHEDGIESYGRTVDLVIATYLENIEDIID